MKIWEKLKFRFAKEHTIVLIALLLILVLGLSYYFLFWNGVSGNTGGLSSFVKSKQEFEAVDEFDANPVNKDFGIVIPKIQINVPVVKDVNGQDENEYMNKLLEGVAHYEGTAVPGIEGNVFIFGHSSSDYWKSSDYKETFRYLDELKEGDEISTYYEGEEYKYEVSENKVVGASEMSVLDSKGAEETLTLMTCWPVGTIENRRVLDNRLKHKNTRIFNNVHVSGHAGREDLRDLINMLNPEHIIPAHGDRKKLEPMVELSKELGYKVNKSVHLLKDGSSLKI